MIYHTHKNFYDQKRNELLASFYMGNFGAVERRSREILEKMQHADEFSEVDQKAINQIRHIFRTFRKPILENCPGDLHGVFTQIRRLLTAAARTQIRDAKSVSYDEWRQKLGLSEDRFRLLLQTVSTLQLTVGCSISCRRCNEWALPGPRKHFSFDAVKKLISELYGAGNREFALYCASDPLDWRCGEKNITHIMAFMSTHGYEPRYGLLTKIPRGSEKIIVSLLKTGVDIGFSITGRNRSRVTTLQKAFDGRLDVQHDTDELLIPAGLDEDFASVKSSVTDSYGSEITPEGAFFIVPTFTSALNLTGQCRIPVTARTDLFFKKKVGLDGLAVEYFKPLEVVDLDGRQVKLNRLLDAQVENIMLDNGSESLVPPGIMNLQEYFKAYGPDAVQRRKSLLRAFSKGLVRDLLQGGKCREDSRKKRYAVFRKRVRDYFDSCRPGPVAASKKKAFSFYLGAIADYLKIHPVEREIVRYLRREDREKCEAALVRLCADQGRTVESLLSENETEPFDLFQLLLFNLLDDPNDQLIASFLEHHPVETADCFL